MDIIKLILYLSKEKENMYKKLIIPERVVVVIVCSFEFGVHKKDCGIRSSNKYDLHERVVR